MSTRPGNRKPPAGLVWQKRFWSKIEVGDPSDCWEWTTAVGHGGYGKCTTADGRTLSAHRVAYLTSWGAIPNGLTLDHLCKNRRCCNPLHLEPVTPGENTLRGDGPSGLNKRKTHCKYGHPFDGDNLMPILRIRADGSPARACLECHRRNSREWYRNITKHARKGEISPCKR